MNKKSRRIPYFLCSWVLAAVFYMQFFVSFLMKRYLYFDSTAAEDAVYILLTQIAAVGLPCLLVCLAKRANVKRTFKIRSVSLKNAVVCVLLGVAAQPVAIVLNMPLSALAYRLNGGVQNAITRPPASMSEVLFLLPVLCVIPAVFEELLMRGLVLGSAERYGMFACTSVTSVLFAVLHNDFSAFLGHTFLGILLAYAVLMTGSVLSAVIAHFSFNAFGLVLDYLLNIHTGLGSLGFFVLLACVGLVLVLFAVYCLYDYESYEELAGSYVCKPLISFVNIPVLLIMAGYIYKNFMR